MDNDTLITLRTYRKQRADDEYHAAMNGLPILYLELTPGETVLPIVSRYGVRKFKGGQVRCGVIIDVPDGVGAQYVGADLARHEAPRWFSSLGVPTVRVSNRPV